MVCKNADIFHLFLAEADHLFYLKTTKTNKKIFEALTEMIFHRVSLSSLMFITFSLQSVCLLEAVQTFKFVPEFVDREYSSASACFHRALLRYSFRNPLNANCGSTQEKRLHL